MFSFERFFSLAGVMVLFIHYFLQVDTYIFSINKNKDKIYEWVHCKQIHCLKVKYPFHSAYSFTKQKTKKHSTVTSSHIEKPCSSIHVQWRSSVTKILCSRKDRLMQTHVQWYSKEEWLFLKIDIMYQGVYDVSIDTCRNIYLFPQTNCNKSSR